VLHVALTAEAAGAQRRDVVVRAGGHRLVSELADDLAGWLGLPRGEAPYGLVVQRTGEHLVPERRLDQVDLREGDIVTLLPPGETVATRRPRPRLRRLAET
jgi:hypothetical protein